MDRIWLRTPGGVVLVMTLPLGEYIDRQWRDGALTRVNEDGTTYVGDPYTILPDPAPGPATADSAASNDEVAGGAEDEGPAGPARPPQNAPKAAWVTYAVQIGVCATEAEAGDRSKAELIRATTPPELEPGGAA